LEYGSFMDFTHPTEPRGFERYYILMEFCATNLYQLGTCHDIPRLKTVMYQLLQGAYAMKQAGVIHGDIKPMNIGLADTLEAPDNICKILDFNNGILLSKSKET